MVSLYVAVGALFPFIPVYYQSLGIALDGIGLLGALSAGAAAVAAPLWGATADHFRSPRIVMPVAAVGAAVSAVLLAVVSPLLPLVITVAALAAFMAGVAPILDARALEVTGGDRNRYSLLRVWGSASFIGSVLLVGWLIDQTQITAMFAVLAGALLATGLIGLTFRGQIGSVAAVPHLTGIGAVLRSPVLGPFLLAILLVWSSNMAINAFFSIHLVAIGAEGALIGAAWAIGALVEVPVMLGYPRLGGRFGVERLLLVGAAVFLVRAIAVLVLRDPLLVTATMALHGVGFALVLVGGVVYVSRHAPEGTAATAQGVLGAVVFGVAAIVGPGVGGLLAGWLGLRGMFTVATIGCGLAVLALAWALQREAQSGADPGAITVV
jgi:PPP family 3-phenylpropionic acid transporter